MNPGQFVLAGQVNGTNVLYTTDSAGREWLYLVDSTSSAWSVVQVDADAAYIPVSPEPGVGALNKAATSAQLADTPGTQLVPPPVAPMPRAVEVTITQSPDGTITILNPGTGVKTEYKPDGTTVISNPKTNQKITITQDGQGNLVYKSEPLRGAILGAPVPVLPPPKVEVLPPPVIEVIPPGGMIPPQILPTLPSDPLPPPAPPG